jgi:transcription elongation GreA/GreB family factor
MVEKRVYLTPNGVKLLQDRIAAVSEELVRLRREKAIAYTGSGDAWHDNPGFNDLEQQERRKARDLAELNDKLACAELCDSLPRPVHRVQIGSIVRCKRTFLEDGATGEEVWEIVGHGESDPRRHRIAYDSPAAEALLGLLPGEARAVASPRGSIDWEVLGLYASWEEAISTGETGPGGAGS